MKSESLGAQAAGLVVIGTLFIGWMYLGAALMPDSVHFGEGYPFEFLIFLIVYLECLVFPLFVIMIAGEKAPVLTGFSLLSLAFIDFWPSGALFFAGLTVLQAFLILGSSREARSLVFGAFSLRWDSEIGDMRARLLGATGLSSALALSLLFLEHRSVYIYAIASVCMFLFVLLCQRAWLSPPAGSSVILDKLLAPLFVTALAGACCAMFSLYVQSVLADSLRVSTIKSWGELQARAGAIIENCHVPGWQVVLALLALWILRVVVASKQAPRMTGPIDITMHLVRAVKKAASLGYLAIVVVCSFAFFGGQADGPAASLRTRLAVVEYTQLQLQWGTYRLVHDAYVRNLFERLWARQNAQIRADIRKLNEQITRFDEGPLSHFNELEEKYELKSLALQTEVGKRYQAIRSIGAPVNDSLKPSKPSASDSLTIGELDDAQRALEAEEDRRTTEKDPDSEIEMLVGLDKAMARDLFDAVLPIEKAAEHAEFLEALGHFFPGTTELMGKVVDGAKEFAFDKVWERSNRALEAFLQRRASRLADAARAQVDTLIVIPVAVIEILPLRSEKELTNAFAEETRQIDAMARDVVGRRAYRKWQALRVASSDPLTFESAGIKSAMKSALDTYKQDRSLEALARLDDTLDMEVAQVIPKVSYQIAEDMEAFAGKKYPRPAVGLGSRPIGHSEFEHPFESHPFK